MNGKKFIMCFMTLIIITGIGISLWIKQAYETRPLIKIVEPVK